jgi:hypothetical protein
LNLGWTAGYPDADLYDISQRKYLERSEKWNCRRTVKISWSVTNSVTVTDDRNCLRTVRRIKAKWIGYILHVNCVLKHAIERKVQGARILGRKRREQLDDEKDTSGN